MRMKWWMQAPEGTIQDVVEPLEPRGIRINYGGSRVRLRGPVGLEWLFPWAVQRRQWAQEHFVGRIIEPFVNLKDLSFGDVRIRYVKHDGWPYVSYRIELPDGSLLRRTDGELYWC